MSYQFIDGTLQQVADGSSAGIMPPNLGNSNNNFLSSFGGLAKDFGNQMTTSIGSGDNATTPLQIGVGLGAIGLNYLNQQKQLKFAKQQAEQNMNAMRTNQLAQGANNLNQDLFQVQALYGQDKNQGMQRAGDVQSKIDTMNTAGSQIGLNNSFANQANALSKYTQGLA